MRANLQTGIFITSTLPAARVSCRFRPIVPRRRLWLHDGSCVRLRPRYRNRVWSYEFVHHRTYDGRTFWLLTVMDEYSRECLAIDVARRLSSQDVLHRLGELLLDRGLPAYIRSDNGPEFTARAVRKWLEELGIGTLFIEPGSPWENGHRVIQR
jgi:putative transposase